MRGPIPTLFFFLFLSGCVLIPDPAARRLFELSLKLTETVEVDGTTVVATWFVPNKVKLQGQFVQISGRLDRSGNRSLPIQVVAKAEITSGSTGKVRKRFRIVLERTGDDRFRGSKRFVKNIAADSLLTVTVEPQGGRLLKGTGVTVCIDVAKTRLEFETFPSCAVGDAATTFGAIEARILAPRCGVGGCHDAATAEEGLVLEAGQAFGNLVNVGARQTRLALVRPGDPERSYLVSKLRGGTPIGGRMPFGGPFLSDDEIAGVVEWIQNGAENN